MPIQPHYPYTDAVCINGTLPYHFSSTSAVYRTFDRGVRYDVILHYTHEVQ